MTRHLVVIGGQRCGTTLLYQLLDAHPEIAMARPVRPEPKVFLGDLPPEHDLDWYHRTYFGHATTESIYGEKSTSYIEDPLAPARVMQLLGTVVVVAQLRDPVARAVSNWRFSTRHGAEDRPLEQALADNLEGPRTWDRQLTSVSPFAYLERGRYADYLEPWYEAFPGAVVVRFLEDGPDRPEQLADLYRRVGVDPTFRTGLPSEPVNASEGERPDLPDALVARLRDYFRDADARLAERLGRPLPWASA